MKQRYKLLILALLIVLLFTIELGWLAVFVLGAGCLWVLFNSSFSWVLWVKKKVWLTGTCSVISIFMLAIFIRVFIFEIFIVPSRSMEQTLQPGDFIVSSKLNYGPSLPRNLFEIPWLSLFFLFSQETRAKLGNHEWEYKRLAGYSGVKRNDVILYKHPHLRHINIVKRCVGMPGEQLELWQGEVFCNGKRVEAPLEANKLYRVWPANKKEVLNLLDSMQLTFPFQQYHNGEWEVTMNEAESAFLMDSPVVDSLKVKFFKKGEGLAVFPHHQNYKWSIDYFGPIRIPARGLEMVINAENLLLYEHILRTYENVRIEEKEGHFYTAGREIKHYTFQQNYYFMLGDNRNFSEDSRFMGFVPEENIMGKATFIIFSKNDDDFKWSRLGKAVK